MIITNVTQLRAAGLPLRDAYVIADFNSKSSDEHLKEAIGLLVQRAIWTIDWETQREDWNKRLREQTDAIGKAIRALKDENIEQALEYLNNL
jgi:DNA-binding transcriptional MerR regulator